ncbi:solute carrier family 22 member 5-like [Haliotis rubra]|uniref:solute carrier family 22 member 5-like n=1 Tax=Haliotis rubra TaxID=36100 RepID=UPI001EE57C8B|nr:solute carrier family 22 member 5-like [Haliotis rubra]
MHLESLIEELGSFGPYQRCIHCILVVCRALSVPPMMMMAFAGVEPDWWLEPRVQQEMESIRWLAVKGHLEEARRIVTRIAKFNKKPVPDMSILELIAEEERAERNKAKSYSYIDLVRTRTLRSRTLITSFLWISISIVYYVITFGVRNLSGDFYLNLMIMALLEVPMSFVELFTVSVFSRRWACAILLSFSAVACIGVSIVTKLAPADIKVPLENGFAISGKLSTVSAWALIETLSSEQYPTVVRNLAYAAQNTAARSGGIVAAQIFSLDSKDDLMPPFLAMGILMSFTALSCFGLEETSEKALEDTMKKYTREGVNEEVEGSLPLNDITLTMNDSGGAKGDIAEMDEYCTYYAKSCGGGTEERGSICQSKVKTIVGLVDNSKPEKNEGEEQRSSNTFLKSEHDI